MFFLNDSLRGYNSIYLRNNSTELITIYKTKFKEIMMYKFAQLIFILVHSFPLKVISNSQSILREIFHYNLIIQSRHFT